MALVQEITRALKRHDRDLFCRYSPAHSCEVVYRTTKRFERVWDAEEFTLSTLKEQYEFVLALTSDWNYSGERRAWGIDQILERVKSMDLAQNERWFEEFEERELALKKSKHRHMENEIEAWAKDSRRAFAKAADDAFGTTVSLDKSEKKRRNRDRRIKDGYY